MFFLLYRQIYNSVLDDFPKISDHFPKISESRINVDENFPKISEDYRSLSRKTLRCFDHTPTNLSTV